MLLLKADKKVWVNIS